MEIRPKQINSDDGSGIKVGPFEIERKGEGRETHYQFSSVFETTARDQIQRAYDELSAKVPEILKGSDITREDQGWELVGEFPISLDIVEDLLKNLDAKLNYKQNFTQVFSHFNKFKYSIFSFFNDPRLEFLEQALKHYEQFKNQLNSSFKQSGFKTEINES